MPKKALRSELLIRRRTMSNTDWHDSSAAAQQRLIALQLFQQASCIALYAPIQHEVDTVQIFHAARSAGKGVLYPIVCGTDLRFIEISDSSQLNPGSFKIPEPCSLTDERSLETADLIVIPGVAFDLQGHRIGFGKGFYDRCLSSLMNPGHLVGLCHDFQLFEQIPAERHDIRMQYVVTENRLIIPTQERQAGTGFTSD
jgi:5-formyltetrahydrofolate cyclo-ligase